MAFVDRLVLPLNPPVAEALVSAFGGVAYIGILRLARNNCWREWHQPEAEMYIRCQAQLGFEMLERAITAHIDRDVKPLVDSITKGPAT